MNIIDFVHKVREMRAAQKAYFQTWLPSDLIRSQELEREVDRALLEPVQVPDELAEGIQDEDHN